MTRVTQTRTGYGTGTCYSAALGSLLDLECETPPFMPDAFRWHGDEQFGDRGMEASIAWLREAGYDLVQIGPMGATDLMEKIRDRNPDLEWVMMTGWAPRMHRGLPIGHCVCLNLQTFEMWDPHPSRAGLISWWCVEALVNLADYP